VSGLTLPIFMPLAFFNVERVLVSFLGPRPELVDVLVADRLPDDYNGSAPAVIVTRVGGEFSTDDHLDRAVVRVDTYGPDKLTALDLAGTVRGLVWLAPEAAHTGGAVVSDVAEDRGPSWLRDPGFPDANRYTTRYLLLIRVAPDPV
jgi:hypothetical protein